MNIRDISLKLRRLVTKWFPPRETMRRVILDEQAVAAHKEYYESVMGKHITLPVPVPMPEGASQENRKH